MSDPRRVLFMLRTIDDDAPTATKNAQAIRNAATLAGQCPICHATLELDPDPIVPGVLRGHFRNDEGCPALAGEAA
ncbi:MAG: hypothetical protein ACKVUT_14215 [Gaiella sp.]